MGTNSSFVALIPKVDCPQSLNEFRLLWFVVYVQRIKLAFPKLIDKTQFVFIRGKNMLDSVKIANEVIHEVKRQKSAALIFKVDYEKSYDSVK